MKRLSVSAILAAAFALLAAPGSALAANARPVSSSALAFPAAFTVTPGGSHIFYGERFTGSIRRLNLATGTSTPFFKVPNVAATGEQGLLGLALHPSYPNNTRVWAFVTRTVSGRATNQLLRIRADGSGFTVLRSFPTGGNHNGGRIMFGPDGKLYVVVGENGMPSRRPEPGQPGREDAAAERGRHGALRQPAGGQPGHRLRHPQLVRVHLRSADGAPLGDGERPGLQRRGQPRSPPRAHELRLGALADVQLAAPGAAQHEPGRAQPGAAEALLRHAAGADRGRFCRLCGLSSDGQLFFGDFNTGTIRRATLTSARTGIASRAPFYDHPDGVLSLETPIDGGPIYFSTAKNIFRLNP